jgi:hypothetical protein
VNPVIQSKQTTPVLVVALLLLGFAITQSAMGEKVPIKRIPNKPPNHPDFRVTLDEFVPCVGERVQLNGTLELHFETINGVAHPKLMAARLEATGTGLSTGRTYVAISTPIDSDVTTEKVLGSTHGRWILKFKVVSNPNPLGQADVCPGCVFQFNLKFTVVYSARAKVDDIFGNREVLCP